MKLTILCEKDEEGHFVMECIELPGCLSEGDTLEEALESINEAIAGCITSRVKTATYKILNNNPENFSFSLEIPEPSHA
ncbi:type II toxin-antitoxin system HicB family antitoxin [Methanospirillum hungatei]|uniref:type II toxin-antitoxin system HicB family antitoxin n=1 Tax=Methanospirillum hungatei TaxID=2203 RepID=UPI0026EBEC60|nr:type II toxin-antitoxin system HicB family antitoxin [Methanospirillum hungatei]MCA1915704.1 type II toxin-antitoxin system HicB family antitoxin [Methanospirillum hungatei]